MTTTPDNVSTAVADPLLPAAAPRIRLNLGYWAALATVFGVAVVEIWNGASITSVLGWALSGVTLLALARCQGKAARLIVRCGQLDGLIEGITGRLPRWPDKPWPALFLIAERSTSRDRKPLE